MASSPLATHTHTHTYTRTPALNNINQISLIIIGGLENERERERERERNFLNAEAWQIDKMFRDDLQLPLQLLQCGIALVAILGASKSAK